MALFSALASIAGGLLGSVVRKREQKAQAQVARRVARGADPFTGRQVVTAGVAGDVGAAGAAGMAGGFADIGTLGITRDQQGAAVQWLTTLGSGAADATLRTLARDMRIGEKIIIAVLMRIGQIGADTLQPAEKVLISNEIERIFKARRRGIIPKSLKRAVKMLLFLKKELRPILK